MNEFVLFLMLTTPTAESLTKQVLASARVLTIAEPDSVRLSPPERISPGAPPLLTFRFLEGKSRHRFGGLDLVMDDAGH
jgi:hypothetical protein